MLLPSVHVPSLVRVKPGALDRLGVYLSRSQLTRVAVLHSHGLLSQLRGRVDETLQQAGIEARSIIEVESASFEHAVDLVAELPSNIQAIVGVGGGRALDVAKYVAFLSNLPNAAVPTSLSNDGFCSPQSSLTLRGKRKSLKARLPQALVVDTQVCLEAPRELWLSGVGDLVAKITAVKDWKLAFHAVGEPVNDLAALLSDSTVRQFMQWSRADEEGARLLATALMLNGIAMGIAGSSRPASGSEHLISHALDHLSERPRLHGLQVGVAAFFMAQIQQHEVENITNLLESTGFFDVIRRDPFDLNEWYQAIDLSPQLKPHQHTILAQPEIRDRLKQLLSENRSGLFSS